VRVGQIAQIKMKFRLLKQESGDFTFRELLKGICVLHDGMSMVRAQNKLIPLRSMLIRCRILLGALQLALSGLRKSLVVMSGFILLAVP
jgi:hypothetical protein